MASSTQLVLLAAGIHLAGLALALVLILPIIRGDESWLRPPEDGEDGGGGGGNDRRGPHAPVGPSGGGIPLPDARPARRRLREPARLGDLRPAPPRRGPVREPAPTPRRVPARG